MTSARSSGRCRSSREALTTAVPGSASAEGSPTARPRTTGWRSCARSDWPGRHPEDSSGPTPSRPRSASERGLRDGVLLVPEALTALRDASPADPLTPEGLFAATRESVPRHDRARDPNWEATWRERADRLLRWLALVDLAERIEAGEAGESEAPEASSVAYVAGEAV